MPRRGVSKQLLDFLIFCYFGGEVSFATHSEVSADKGLQIAVEDTVYVADFYTGAEVFGHAVGLENVAANL